MSTKRLCRYHFIIHSLHLFVHYYLFYHKQQYNFHFYNNLYLIILFSSFILFSISLSFHFFCSSTFFNFFPSSFLFFSFLFFLIKKHVKYPNVFGLGDCTNAPKSRTAAAISQEAPVAAGNLLNLINNKPISLKYNGYVFISFYPFLSLYSLLFHNFICFVISFIHSFLRFFLLSCFFFFLPFLPSFFILIVNHYC